MSNIDNLVNLIRQRAFLEAGGGRRDPSVAIGEIFGNTGKGMLNFSEARNKNIESILLGEKMDREAAKQASELTPMRDLNPTTVLTRENATINKSTTPEQRVGMDKLYARREAMGDTNLAQAKTQAEISNLLETNSKTGELSLKKAIESGYASRELVKKVFPDLKDGEDVSIGEFNSRKDLMKQNNVFSQQDELFDKRERQRMDREERDAEKKRLSTPPTVEAQYKSLRDQSGLAENIKKGLNHAIDKGLNVTGFLASPYNKFQEFIGTLPKEEQDILTELRLNFADFVRERGGTAFTTTEKEVFGPIMPETNKDEKTNLNRIEKMLDNIISKQITFEQQYPGLSYTYDPSGNKPRDWTSVKDKEKIKLKSGETKEEGSPQVKNYDKKIGSFKSAKAAVNYLIGLGETKENADKIVEDYMQRNPE